MYYARNVFHKAAEAMLRVQMKDGGKLAPWIREHIIHSQKFIVPDAGQMTAGTPFDDYKDVMRLPFPRISLLREIEVDGRPISQIILASAPEFVNESADFWVSSIFNVPGTDHWAPERPIGIDLRGDSSGRGILQVEIPAAIEEETRLYGAPMQSVDRNGGWGAMNGLFELLVMLSLRNVSTRRIEPSKKLNAKRERNKKLPLYDYHVLLIDGQEVHGSEPGSKSDRQIRSHYRRGHIRRLDDTRRVWVRATFVHGSARGFVDKDYRANPERLN